MRFLVALVVGGVSACTYPNQFRNVPAGQPSASLTTHGVGIFRINEKPTSFWRVGDYFKVPPGRITLELVAEREPYSYEPMTFTAKGGRRYFLKASDDKSSVSLSDVMYEDGPRELAVAKRLRD